MSYQTPVLSQITSPPQAFAEVVLNTDLLATQHQAVYGLDEVATSGLNLWLIAGRWGGFSYTPAALTLTASSTNYVVVAIATGVPSVSTATTNWNDATNYVRAYKLTTSATTITALEDHRAGPRGVHGGAGGVTTSTSGIPINSQSAAYTTVLADANGAIYHPAADTTARTFTIAANSSVAYPVGTAITFDNDVGAGVLTLAINTDTLVLVGTTGSTGSRTLASGGQATALKVTSTRWRINGNGLT